MLSYIPKHSLPCHHGGGCYKENEEEYLLSTGKLDHQKQACLQTECNREHLLLLWVNTESTMPLWVHTGNYLQISGGV